MPAYLFDSSAIAKRYCHEAGTDRVEAILADSTNLCLISRLSVVELHSVFATKVRRRELTQHDFDLLRRRFLSDGKQRIFSRRDDLARRLSPGCTAHPHPLVGRFAAYA